MKFALVIIVGFVALLPSSAFAYTSPDTNYIRTVNDPGRFMCDDFPSSPPDDCNAILGTFATNGAIIYVTGSNDFNGTYTVISNGMAGDNVSLQVSPTMPDHTAGSYSGAIFSDTPPAPPAPAPSSYMPDPFALIVDITQGVQATGALIWPLFVFLGLIIAFYIAERVGDFMRNSVGKPPKKRKYKVGTEDEYPKDFRDAYVEAVDISSKAHPK